jgi:hypothetical protein
MELVLGLSPDEPVARRILQEYQIFMKGVISFPITIPGTPFARAVKVMIEHLHFVNFQATRTRTHAYPYPLTFWTTRPAGKEEDI